MRIMVCGSMAFAKDMLNIKKKLEKLGHEVQIPQDTTIHSRDPQLVDDLDRNIVHAKERDLIRASFKQVAECEGILVLNLHRKGIGGYIGTSALMEIGIAYYLGKKIFLYNPIPHFDEVRWAHEIAIIDPVVIDNDLEKIQ